MQNYLPNQTGKPKQTAKPKNARRAVSVDGVFVALLGVLVGTVAALAAIITIGATLPAWAAPIVLAPAAAAVIATFVLSAKYPAKTDPAQTRDGSSFREGSHGARPAPRHGPRGARRGPAHRPRFGSGDLR